MVLPQTAHSKSWQADKVYIRVQSSWAYLYRNIDSNGFTLDYELRKHHAVCYSLSFLEASFDDQRSQHRATLKAEKHLIQQEFLSESAHRCSAS